MLKVNPAEVSVKQMHAYLLGAVIPRPIAFASTIDKDGNVNLSPFSFFNVFGSNPATLIFSPARRGRDNTIKDTLENVREVPEVVISIVSYDIVEQMSLSSTEYGKGVNEFIKSGLNQVSSEKVSPPRVAESKVHFECTVKDIIALGDKGGAGNLVICEVQLMHISEDILDAQGRIDPAKLDPVGRMGGDTYVRASGDSLFNIAKPLQSLGIGIDNIPADIRISKVLSGNDLGRLGNVESLPDPEQVKKAVVELGIEGFDTKFASTEEAAKALHEMAKGYIEKGDIMTAWMILLSNKKS